MTDISIILINGIKWWMDRSYITTFLSRYGKIIDLLMGDQFEGENAFQQSYCSISFFKDLKSSIKLILSNNDEQQFTIEVVSKLPEIIKTDNTLISLLNGKRYPMLFENSLIPIILHPNDLIDNSSKVSFVGSLNPNLFEKNNFDFNNNSSIQSLNFLQRNSIYDSEMSTLSSQLVVQPLMMFRNPIMSQMMVIPGYHPLNVPQRSNDRTYPYNNESDYQRNRDNNETRDFNNKSKRSEGNDSRKRKKQRYDK